MNDVDFPALYQSANDLSLRSQRRFFFALSLHLACLIGTAALSSLPPSQSCAVWQLTFLLGALACSIFLFGVRPERDWYEGRAVAESIKTMTWRYVCRAEPFQGSQEEARTIFLHRIKAVLDQNRAIAKELSAFLVEPQITPAMDRIRALAIEERKRLYARTRVDDQLSWYAKKAKGNRYCANTFFWALIAINIAAVTFAVLKVTGMTLGFWPVDVLVASAASLLSWMQAKKFTELAAAYTLTAHEIALVRGGSQLQRTEAEFSAYVGDAEAAFSREHTQWIARRDQ